MQGRPRKGDRRWAQEETVRSLESHTRLRPPEVLNRALAFFGPQGLGLPVKQRQLTRIELQDGEGSVTVRVLLDREKGGTAVEVIEREWDRKAEDFLASLPPRRGRLWRRLPLLGRLR